MPHVRPWAICEKARSSSLQRSVVSEAIRHNVFDFFFFYKQLGIYLTSDYSLEGKGLTSAAKPHVKCLGMFR